MAKKQEVNLTDKDFEKIPERGKHPNQKLKAYAVISIKNGDDIKTVQNNLGHATASFTLDVYGHVTEQMKRDSSSRMEHFIQGISALR